MTTVTASRPSGRSASGRRSPRTRSIDARGAARSITSPRVAIAVYLSPAAFRCGSALADHSKNSFEPNS